MCVTLDGAARELFFSTEAGVGADLGQVVRAFSALEKVARQSPVRTLQLTAEMSEPPWDDPTAVPVKLLFQNRGAEGFWIREPATFPVRAPLPQLARATDGAPDVDEDELPHEVTPSLARHELCEVICMVERRVPRDVTPMLSPTRLRLEPVTAATDDPAAVVWIDGQGSLTRHFTVSIPPVMRPSRDAPLLLRATWSSYVGEELFEGRPRMRGCVFSDELTLRGA